MLARAEVHPVVAEKRQTQGRPFLIVPVRMDVGVFLIVSRD